MEECKNNWPDGTCPQCGETHYVVVRRTFITKLKRERDEADTERMVTSALAEAAMRDRDTAWAEVERLKADYTKKELDAYSDRAEQAEAALARMREVLGLAEGVLREMAQLAGIGRVAKKIAMDTSDKARAALESR